MSRDISRESRPTRPIKERIEGGPELARVLTQIGNERAKVKTFRRGK